MRVVVGIPARIGSSRFPGKPLAKIAGLPMIEHVYRRCEFAKFVDEVFIATCDDEIYDVAINFCKNVFMTDKNIARPGLRVAEATKYMDLKDEDLVVVVQGDEPLVHPDMINIAVEPLIKDINIKVLTLVAHANEQEWLDPNEVKVVTDLNNDILYMTRAPIPSNTRGRIGPRLKQVAIMPFKKDFLINFQNMSPTPLEIAESIELLRAVEHGIKVKTALSPYRTVSVDTEKDRQEAESIMVDDEIFKQYGKKREKAKNDDI